MEMKSFFLFLLNNLLKLNRKKISHKCICVCGEREFKQFEDMAIAIVLLFEKLDTAAICPKDTNTKFNSFSSEWQERKK